MRLSRANIGKRSSDWLKIKVTHTADFEVIGCVPMRGEKAIRVLLLGEKHQGRLVYKGKGHSRNPRQGPELPSLILLSMVPAELEYEGDERDNAFSYSLREY